MRNRETNAAKAGKYTVDALGSIRPYSVLVTIVEVFFRYDMGVRYFTWRVFANGLISLALMRFVYAYPIIKHSLGEYLALELYYFDAFALLYLLLSIRHFWKQSRYEKDMKIIHSYDMGDSHFFRVGRWFSKTKYPAITYRYLEPLILILLIVPVATFSFFLAFLTFVAACRLLWSNWTVINRLKAEGWDINDRKIEAGEIQGKMKEQERRQRSKKQAKPRKAKRQEPQKSTKAETKTLSSSPDVQEVLKRRMADFDQRKGKS